MDKQISIGYSITDVKGVPTKVVAPNEIDLLTTDIHKLAFFTGGNLKSYLQASIYSSFSFKEVNINIGPFPTYLSVEMWLYKVMPQLKPRFAWELDSETETKFARFFEYSLAPLNNAWQEEWEILHSWGIKKGRKIDDYLCQYHLPIGWLKKRSYFSSGTALIVDEIERIRAAIYFLCDDNHWCDYTLAVPRYSIFVEPTFYLFENAYVQIEKCHTITQKWTAKVYDQVTLKLVCKSDAVTILAEEEWKEWSKQNCSPITRIVSLIKYRTKQPPNRYEDYVLAIKNKLHLQASQSLSRQLGNSQNPLYCWD